MSGRWEYTGVLGGQQFAEFWRTYLNSSPRNLLYILGLGFDPRMNQGISAIKAAGGLGKRRCQMITWDAGLPNIHSDLVLSNERELMGLAAGWGDVAKLVVASDRASSLARQLVDSYTKGVFIDFTDVVVDVSALPRELFFPIISKLLMVMDGLQKDGITINLHVVVCDDPELDSLILQEGDQADYILGFAAGFDQEVESEVPRIWAPVLGEEQAKRLEKLWAFINPHEVCPIVPFPSGDPRRGDKLVIQYWKLMDDTWHVDPRNIMYVSEQNPFDIYRRLRRVREHYSESLEKLGRVQMAVSALSSKLLSIGVLLAAHEEKMAVGYAGGLDHRMAQSGRLPSRGQLYTMWLAGDPYV